MNIELGTALVTPVLALLAGILILVAPRVLNYLVTVYLNVVGLEPPVRFEAALSPAGTPALLPDREPVTIQPEEEHT